MWIPLPAPVEAYRRAHRERHIGPRYRGWLHLGVTTTGRPAAIASNSFTG